MVGLYQTGAGPQEEKLTIPPGYGSLAASSLSPASFLKPDAGEPSSPDNHPGRGERRGPTRAKATFKAEPVS